MLDKMNYVELEGKKYPYICSIGVLEAYQEKYGSVNNFQNALLPKNKTEGVNVKELVWSWDLMLKAGEKFAKRKGEEPPEFDEITIEILLSEMGIVEAATLAVRELARGINPNMEMEKEKNGKTTESR